MAKEYREIIAFQEQQAAQENNGQGNPIKLGFLKTLRSLIDYGQEAGHIDASLPNEAGIIIPQPRSEAPAQLSQRRETISSPVADQTVKIAIREWRVKDIPAPPAALFEVLERARKEGFTSFEPFYEQRKQFKKNSKFPGRGIKPEDWFWQNIQNGNIDQDAAHLHGTWTLIDATPKPQYTDGTQMYENDERLGHILQIARSQGLIKITDWTKHVPKDSRFGVSWDEINQTIAPEVAALLGVEKQQVSVPREIEFNIAGNIRHPEWGDTNTWEWVTDSFGLGFRLVGGYSGYGGLAYVNGGSAGNHSGSIGFRLRVGFPQK